MSGRASETAGASGPQRGQNRGWTSDDGVLRRTVVPLLLLLVTPPLVLVLWVAVEHHGGSLQALLRELPAAFGQLPRPSAWAAAVLVGWGMLQWVLLVGLPGRTHLGPVTRGGNRPRYRLNGVAAFLVTHALGALAVVSGVVDPAIVYDRYGELLATSSLFALLLCGLLYAKGRLAPTDPDSGPSGHVVSDLFWGIELHPRALGVSVKQWLICRCSMMAWSVVVLSAAAAQVDRHGELSSGLAVSVALQVVYIFKFFVWEGGYFDSMDIAHDRLGFYIAWGVLAWLPGVYPIATLYLVDHPAVLATSVAVGIFLFGLVAILVNYAADAQRQRVRRSGGRTRVWGRRPELVRARYVTTDGEHRENLLLASGFWGVSRHFHYLPELALAIAWTMPAGLHHVLPWFYVLFLAILLIDRAGRDDRRCAAKYGADWAEYCRRVPWRMLPGVY